ncbi:Fk506-binding protein 2 [Pelagophyceae sp. CCMP2097]|nr:Fk506-binding protein 2 [Pelagophyceae sp. CCMP2097]
MRSQASDVVEIDYVGRLSDGTVFDSRDRFALLLGNGEVVKGLELGLFEMCIGERRIITVPAALGFGDRGSKTFRVPPGAALEYEVQMRGINLQVDPAVKRADLDAEQRFK